MGYPGPRGPMGFPGERGPEGASGAVGVKVSLVECCNNYVDLFSESHNMIVVSILIN